jgi:hypothetical protein
MSRWVCKLCVIQKGLKGSDLDQWPEAPDDAWIAEHLRTAHGVEVRDATDKEQQAGLTEAVGRWVPFHERPRPDADLARVQLTLEPGKGGPGRIIVATENYDQAGRVFAWLMGQMHLARIEVEPATRKDWGFE